MQTPKKEISNVQCVFEMSAYGMFALVSCLPGMLLRGVACFIMPYTLSRPSVPEESCPSSRSIKILSWNICCLGGCAIKAGVLPYADRIDEIIAKIIEIDPDVISLQETFLADFRIQDMLRKRGYHVGKDFGMQAFKFSSGILIASKQKMQNVQFKHFPVEAVHGSERWFGKGGITFDVMLKNKTITICTSHLQSPENPHLPTEQEHQARAQQASFLRQMMRRHQKDACVLVGDLNQDLKEVQKNFPSFTMAYPSLSASLSRESASVDTDSQSCTLDYIGYDSRQMQLQARCEHYETEALSDHNPIVVEYSLHSATLD